MSLDAALFASTSVVMRTTLSTGAGELHARRASVRGKAVHHDVAVLPLRRQRDLLLPFGHVDRARKGLCFQAYTRMFRVTLAALARQVPLQKVAGVELHARRVGIQREQAARRRVPEP